MLHRHNAIRTIVRRARSIACEIHSNLIRPQYIGWKQMSALQCEYVVTEQSERLRGEEMSRIESMRFAV